MFSNFEDLYLGISKLLKKEPKDLSFYQDLDRYFSNIELFKLPGELILYEKFPYQEKLDPDYVDKEGKYYIWYFPYEEKILSTMDNNKTLNKWKLKQLELVSKLGWKKYCDLEIDRVISSPLYKKYIL